MKTILIGIILILSFSGNSQNDNSVKETNKSVTVEEKNNENLAKKIANELAESLNLSDDQKERVRIVELGVIQKKEDISNNKEFTKEEKENYFTRINRRRIQMINSVLDPEQKKRLVEIEEKK